jgi:hypothetical protein
MYLPLRVRVQERREFLLGHPQKAREAAGLAVDADQRRTVGSNTSLLSLPTVEGADGVHEGEYLGSMQFQLVLFARLDSLQRHAVRRLPAVVLTLALVNERFSQDCARLAGC